DCRVRAPRTRGRPGAAAVDAVTPVLAGPRAGAAALSGILAIDKTAGMTSFDAVRRVPLISHEKRVGPAGTLDPTATGLLPVCIGQATRLVDYFHQQNKT